MIDLATGEIINRQSVFVRSAYNYDTDAVSRETGLVCEEETRTQQQFAEECDINTIVRRFGLTGELPQDVKVPLEGDYIDAVTDYQSALNMVIKADDSFMEMPADVRARFNNDPQRLMEFVQDGRNAQEARKMGLLVPEKGPEMPVLVKVMPEAPLKGGVT